MLKKLIAVALTLCMLSALLVTGAPASAETPLPFTDVKEGKWFYSAVKYVYDIGIMNGTNSEGTLFEPDVTVTRAMFVAMLGRLHGAEETLTKKYPDVKSDKLNWYNGYVGWASENGIITGYDNGKFGPNDEVTREQMATIISRYINYLGIVPKLSIDAPASFPDAAKVANYAKAAVEDMRMMGIIQGTNTGAFDPKGKLNRASAATIIMRLDVMLDDLELGEAIHPDYTVEGENFALMGAWDLYYGGTALDTGYEGIGVKTDAEFPYISEDANGKTFDVGLGSYRDRGDNDSFGEMPQNNPLVGDCNFYEIDMRIACIDPAKFPFIRFAYRSNGDVKFGVYSDNAESGVIDCTPADEKVAGFKYGIADITGKWSDASLQITPTLFSTSDIDLLYFAAFPDKQSAEAFDVTKYKNDLAKYDGEVVELKAATESDVDAVLAEADAAAQAIINNTDDISPSTITGTCYYISNKGNDNNDGRSPDKAWASFKNLYNVYAGGAIIANVPVAGDAVFLERGSVFNSNTGDTYNYLNIVPGVTYAAYGEGAKPVITRELPMNEPAGKWSKTEYANVWKLDYDIVDNPGNIVFVKKDGTELWGIMSFPEDYTKPFSGKTHNYGIVSNGEETFHSGGIEFKNVGCLQNNLEYFGDAVNGGLYVYFDKGNPGEVFGEIHISTSYQIVGYSEKSPATTIPTRFDNIALKYAGGCGIGTGSAENIYITNCTFEWIGGAYQSPSVRYGNAIQNWGDCDGFVVRDCYFRDIYDAAVSTQGNTGIMRNFYASGCVLDRCDLSFEFFNHGSPEFADTYPNPELVNLYITDNYVINNGFGYCDVRTDRRSAFLYTTYGINDTKYENIVYEGNVNVFSAEYAIYSCELALGKTEGTMLRNNVYYMDPAESYYGKIIYNMIDRTGYTQALYPYTSQYLTYLNSIGVETGSTFYTTVNPAIDGSR